MSDAEVPANVDRHSITFRATIGETAEFNLSCDGSGDAPCSFSPQPCPYATAVGEGIKVGFRLGWNRGIAQVGSSLSDLSDRPSNSPVTVQFAPGSIQITLPEREVHVDAPITVQLPERSTETLEIVRDKDGKMSRIRRLEAS